MSGDSFAGMSVYLDSDLEYQLDRPAKWLTYLARESGLNLGHRSFSVRILGTPDWEEHAVAMRTIGAACAEIGGASLTSVVGW